MLAYFNVNISSLTGGVKSGRIFICGGVCASGSLDGGETREAQDLRKELMQSPRPQAHLVL